jgi:hypothetical protein
MKRASGGGGPWIDVFVHGPNSSGGERFVGGGRPKKNPSGL